MLLVAETVAVRQRQAVTGPRGLNHLTSESPSTQRTTCLSSYPSRASLLLWIHFSEPLVLIIMDRVQAFGKNLR